MGKVIRFRISGRGGDTDAPTAEDLLGQIQDHLDILREVETAIAEDGQSAIVWRVVNASKNTPLTFELEAYARQYAVNIDNRALVVAKRTAEGLAELQKRPGRPLGFTDRALTRAERIFERVTNGLDLSEVDFGDGLPDIVITPPVAHLAIKNVRLALAPTDRPYKEFGGVEGIFQSVGRDGFGRKLLYIRHRVSGEEVKCILEGEALKKIEQISVAEVYRGRRVVVVGTVRYRGLGKISQIDAVDAQFVRGRDELPSVDDILDESFTGGLSTEEYLERLRDGRLS